MRDWKKEIAKASIEDGLSWRHVAEIVQEHFPDLEYEQAWNKGRDHIRKLPEYKDKQKREYQQSSLEYKSDGTKISEKFITVRDGEEMTPRFILEAHGFDPWLWEVVSYKNNMWNTQIKGGHKQISYQSKLTAKPIAGGISFSDIEEHFKKLDRANFKPTKYHSVKDGDMMAEVNIVDLHLGKLCWSGDTPENYDYKIARDVFYGLIQEIASELKSKNLEYITFVWAHDFFNSDNEMQQTTGGTPQDTDIREKKLFNVGVEMLVRATEMLRDIAPVRMFYIRSNHDEQTAYHALKYLEAWFRHDSDVTVDTNAYPRKYQVYGNTLIGYCHGDKENSKGSYEKASRLASLMPLEASEWWGQTCYHEMHTAHLHSEQMHAEINGVIVRRISSPTALDTWHVNSGFLGAVRKAQTFIYSKKRGLVYTINTPVVGE